MTLVEQHDDGAVRVLRLNRPEARNALSGELVVALYDALVAADSTTVSVPSSSPGPTRRSAPVWT